MDKLLPSQHDQADQMEQNVAPEQAGVNEERVSRPSGQWRLSADMAEIVLFAQKLSRVKHPEQVSDRDVLLALLLSNRLFSPLDAFLKHAGVKPKALLKALNEASKQQPDAVFTTTALTNASVLAERYPDFESAGQIGIAHVLLALTESPDVIVRQVFAQFQLTQEKLLVGIEKAQKQNAIRIACFMTRELGEVLVFVLFFLIIIKSFLGELRLIPSESMVPTLAVDDRIVIERVTPWFRPYERRDVLVFYPPMTQLKDDPWSLFLRLTGFSGLIYKKEDNIDVAYIKRLVGLPGDVVDVRPGVGVVVNGKLLTEPYTREVAQSCTLEPKFVAIPNDRNDNHRTLFLGESGKSIADLEMWQFELKNGVLRNATPIPKDQTGRVLKTQSLDYASHACLPVEVPKGHYFLMGDNRNESLDSRYWGFEPKDRVIGRAVYRVWPINRLSGITP